MPLRILRSIGRLGFEGTDRVSSMPFKGRVATLMPIRKMNRAIRFYTKTLGGKLQERGRGQMKNFWASVKLGDADIWLISPEAREPRTLAYTALLVKNIKAVVKDLTGKRVKFKRATRMSKETKIEGPIAFEQFGASAFFQDSEGNVLMLWQNVVPM